MYSSTEGLNLWYLIYACFKFHDSNLLLKFIPSAATFNSIVLINMTFLSCLD